jgi:apolipoprotein D and lipocalin family protein
MRLRLYFALLMLSLFIANGNAEAGASLPPLNTVERVDLCLYLGKWYEIARLPNSFQEGCVGSSAEYSLRDDGEIDVVNSCQDSIDGKLRQAKGRAWIVDSKSNARLKVSFFWPFRGDYWIIELGSEYEYAVIGTPGRKYFWILSRNKTISDELYAGILKRAAENGFDVRKVRRETPGAEQGGAR